MKKLTILLVFLLSTIVLSKAQTLQAPVTADQKADEVVNKMKSALSLTDDQTPKVKEITVDRIQKVTEARKKYGADKTRIASANKLIFDEWETKLKGILTLEQYNQYVESKSQF
jgi:hypothetical protein